MKTDFQKKYRFTIEPSGAYAFESRYYAQKFINDFLLSVRAVNVCYEICKITDWFYIYEVRRVIIDEDYISV